MAGKNQFSGALSKQRAGVPKTGGTAGVIGDAPNPFREQIEEAAGPLQVQEIALDRLHDNPYQRLARPVLDEAALDELTGSIRQHGFYGALLARPRRNAAGQYEIAYGHRRREAARRAGLQALPVKVMDLTDRQMAQLMASENFSREDLTPLGEANIVGHLYNDQNLSIEEIATAVGKKRGWVQPRLALYQAPQDVKELVEQKPEALSHARLLPQIKDSAERASLIEQIVRHGLTFEQLNAYLGKNKTARAGATSPNIDKNFTSRITDVDSDKNHNPSPGKNRPAAIVGEITSGLSDVDSEKSNIVSHETSPRNTGGNLDEIITSERLQRSELLRRIDKASLKLDELTRKQNYTLAADEKSYLSDLVVRLRFILER